MDFDDYQKKCARTDTFDAGEWKARGAKVGDPAFSEKVMGLAGEAGEAVDKFKKVMRDRGGEISEADKVEITKELGDVLWYLATLARYMGLPFSEVAAMNVEKMESRLARNKLHGEGDNR